MESMKTESIQCPTFSGEGKDFSIWWTRFQAFGLVKRFDDVMLAGSTRHPKMPASHSAGADLDPLSTDVDVVLGIKIMKQNDVEMAYLTLAFKSARLMRMVRGAKTTEYPYGLADLVLKAKNIIPGQSEALGES